MEANSNAAHLVPRTNSLAELSDVELLTRMRRLVGRSNQLLAELLAHLGEVEARGIHRTRACSSLYTYCIYELRFSEDEAFRRVAAARLVRRFPVLLDALGSGELHLTGLLMLGPHLTEANLVEVLARSKHRTKREIGRLVRILDPLPAIPARIEPLGPAPASPAGVVPATPNWEDFVQSTCPVRELPPGERPRDWLEDEAGQDASTGTPSENLPKLPGCIAAPARVDAKAESTQSAEGRRSIVPEPLAPERYKVQFTASEEYVRLVEEAKSLLSHAVPNVKLEELQLRAMRALVSELSKKKYASTQRPMRPRVLTHGAAKLHATDTSEPRPAPGARHIPAAVRRAVFERDGNRCGYVDANGHRCRETQRLEFHHLKPFALGGEHKASNLGLRCAAHNALAAEEDLGHEFVEQRRNSHAHDSHRRAEAGLRASDGLEASGQPRRGPSLS